MKNNVLLIGTRWLILEKDACFKALNNSWLSPILANNTIEGYEKYDIKHFIEIDFRNHLQAIDKISTYLRQNNLIVKWVTWWSDDAPEIVSLMAKKLNTPWSDHDCVINCRNKSKTRKILNELEDVNPEYEIFEDYNSYKQAIKKIWLPAIIKYPWASWWRWIFIIRNENEIDSKYAEYEKTCQASNDSIYDIHSGQVLLEQFIEWTEHSIWWIVSNWKVSFFSISDKKIDPVKQIQYQNVIPSLLDFSIQKNIERLSLKAIKKVWINNTGFHIDFKINKNNKIKILEIWSRLWWECINSHLIPFAFNGLNPYELLLQTINWENPKLKDSYIFDANSRAISQTIYSDKPWTISDIRWLEKLRNHPNIKRITQVKNIWNMVEFPPDNYFWFAIAHILFKCELNNDNEKLLAEILNGIEITIKD